MIKKIFLIFSTALFVYMLWPGPSKISQFKALPNSAKSTLSGDTTQIKNVSAYFSNDFRDFVTLFYLKNYQQLSIFPFPPLRLNHPPEYSWVVIKKPTDTTYLEEFVYPLRDSIYVNGFERNRPDGTPIFYGAPKLEEGGKEYYTKATLRLYTSNFIIRIIVWAQIVISIFLIFKVGKKVFQ